MLWDLQTLNRDWTSWKDWIYVTWHTFKIKALYISLSLFFNICLTFLSFSEQIRFTHLSKHIVDVTVAISLCCPILFYFYTHCSRCKCVHPKNNAFHWQRSVTDHKYLVQIPDAQNLFRVTQPQYNSMVPKLLFWVSGRPKAVIGLQANFAYLKLSKVYKLRHT